MIQLVLDAGVPRFMGILSISDGLYTPYYERSAGKGIERIRAADQVITFNGNRYDLTGRGAFPELQNLPETVTDIDMMGICWCADHKLFGKGLKDINLLLFGSLPFFPDTYEGDNERDCRMTLKLFQSWQVGQLRAS